MSDLGRSPLPVARRRSSSSSPLSPGFSALAPEIQDQHYGRLGGMGLIYAATWLAVFVYFRTVGGAAGHPDRQLFWHTMTLLSILLGLVVYLLCRKKSVPPRHFPNFASAFEVLGGLGITAGYFGFEHNGEVFMLRAAEALGIGADRLLTDFITPIHEGGLRLLYVDGVSWVSVWIIAFPLVVPTSMGRTVLATLLTAATVPGLMLISTAVNGIPESMRLWVPPYVVEASIPTFICAGIAIYGAGIMHKLTQDLSKARRMGSYELVEEIGTGGMGEVWRAEHRMLARPAAIKLIRGERLDSKASAARTALKRFELEVQLTTQLKHPNTITIFDYGRTPDGTFYYVMELLDGLDLETFVDRFGPAPASRVLHWLHQACGSLSEAHARGMTHRDVKPANLYACRHGLETDFLKVLDFGLVKLDHTHRGEDTRMTLQTDTTGTPAYMPPELAMGEEADPRSDLYSLGCVAYWLLTGVTVFDGDTPMQLLVQHAKDTPVPPSQRSELDVPADLEALVLSCLEKNRDQRPQSAQEMMRRIESCTDFGGWTERSRTEWWQRHLPESSPE